MSGTEGTASPEEPERGEGRILWVHPGHSANCSSVGSVVDYVLFAGTAGAALLAGLAVWLNARTDRGPESEGGSAGGSHGDSSEPPPTAAPKDVD
ncbi:MAG: hypothetical protein R3A78_09825 [Polyangiales bacterium]|nr:hypothetical protein [Myxococcales bacterium]